MGASAVFALGLNWATPALAQDDDANERGSGDTIVVTARKREESLRDVPVAVSTLTQDQIDNLVLDSAEDFIRQFPSVSLLSSGTEILTGISIRGQGGGRNGFAETATGLYRNGIYIAGGGFGGRSLTRMDFFDVGQIEVLRGPQGSLFGRNAVGGSVNVNSRRPELDDVNGFVRADHWVTVDRTDLRGAVNIPIVEDKLAVRVGGYSYQQQEGFHQNTRPGREGEFLDQKSYEGARLQALWAPNETTEVLVGIEWSDDKAPAFANIGFNAAHDLDFYNHDISDPAFAETEELFAYTIIDGELGTNTWRFSASRNQRDGERINEDLDHFIGFQDRSFFGTEVILFASQTEEYEAYTADFFIASDTDQRISWLFGAEYVGFEDDYDTFNFGQSPPIAGFTNTLRDDLAFETLDSFAVYGSLEFNISDRLDLGFEMRVQHDAKDFSFERLRNEGSTAATFEVDTSEEWTAFTPTVSFDYALTDQQSLYGRVATAYRPGGFNASIPPELGLDVIVYDNEYTVGGEVGWKGFFGPLNLTLAGYVQRTEDLQVATSASATVRSFILQNVPDATFYGLEFEGVGQFDVGPGELFMTFGATTVDGEYGEGSTIVFEGTELDIEGNRVSKTRDLNTQINVLYQLPITASVRAFASVSHQTESGGFDSAANPPDRKFQGFEIFDARAGIRTDRYELSVWGRNLADERFEFAAVSGNLYYSDGRVWGLTAQARF